MNSSIAITSVLTFLCSIKLLLGSSPGYVIGWGHNSAGEAIGFRLSEAATGNVEIDGKPISDAIAIAAGKNHALAIREDGTVVGWGLNLYGQTNVPIGLKNSVAISAGKNFSIALNRKGEVSVWGDGRDGQTTVPDIARDVVAISAGVSHALALRHDGTVVRWGQSNATMPDNLTNVSRIAAGGGKFDRNLVLRKDGTLLGWGTEHVPQGISNVTEIAIGDLHSLALKTDGTVFGWGNNNHGEATGIPSPNRQRYTSGLVIKSGHVLSNVVAIAAGNEYGVFGTFCRYSLALKNDGTVVAWGVVDGKPVTVPGGLSNIVAIAAGYGFSLAITTNAAVAARFRY